MVTPVMNLRVVWLFVGAVVLMLALLAVTHPETQRSVSSAPQTQSEEATSKPWPMNARGQTYGIQIDYQEPDLVAVAATNNRSGYAYKKDLRGPEPSSPEEALRWQAEQGGRSRYIPVYRSDGVTEIGVFRISGAAPAP